MKPCIFISEIPQNISNDLLTDYINCLVFVPHAFGHQHNDLNAVCSSRITGDFELIYIIGGESHISIGQNKYICTPGDVVLIPPFTIHQIQTPASNPHDNYWIHFDVQPFYKHDDFISVLLGENGNVIPIGINNQLISLYRSLESEIDERRPGTMAYFKTLLVQIIITLLRSAGNHKQRNKEMNGKYSVETDIVHKSLEFIQDNIFSQIRISDICENLHISPSCLFKSFAKVLRLTPNEIIRLFKIKKAEFLMKSTSYSVKQISEMLFFSSPYYFSNVFKKYYHVCPRDYMRIVKNL